MNTEGSVRLDSWLWAVRRYKTRSQATTACRAGHVRVNGDTVKASTQVKLGDEVRVRVAGFDSILEVTGLITKRVGAPAAALAAKDNTPPRPSKLETAAPILRDRGAGRPTKRERRALDELRGFERD
ncbi:MULTISPECIES: RNA-binding S4 domain-containing protein [Mycetocola]|uniref:RNA-binding S4 domain-containing protein n=1 Tax=Mycetocola TaxID=76634 RepID=UPI0004C0CE48|nr:MULTISPECIES: RNA-binding S4 domain-containing protein [Mycetocola]